MSLGGELLRRPSLQESVRDLPWKTKRWSLDTQKHRARVEWVLERLEYSANAKREIERMAQIADQHYCSWINERKNPFAVKTYDPVIFSTCQARLAKVSDAMFSTGPIFDYEPGDGSTFEQARAMSSVVNYHLREIRPRLRILKGFLGNMLVGTQAWHMWWDYRRRKRSYWKRVPLKVAIRDVQTGKVSPIWVQDGDWAYVKRMRTVRDSPNLRPLHITQWYPDDTVEDVQDGEFFIFVDTISAIDARERVQTDGWDSRAVERAIAGDLPERGSTSLRNAMDWQSEMGVRNETLRRATFVNTEKREERGAVEVIECWRRTEFDLQRIIVLNRSWVCFDGPSPFGHGLFPFVVTRNYPLHGRFWGLSDYQVIRYLNRGIQAMRGAAGTEALNAAMPPMIRHQGITITGKRWGEMGGEWVHNGPPNWKPEFVQAGTVSRQIAHSEAEQMLARLDAALGSSDPGRGSLGDKDVKATALNIAFQAAGMRDKLLIESFTEDFTLPCGDQFQELVQQFQSREVEIQITGRQDRVPVTVFPEEFRDASLYGTTTASTSALKALKEKRVGDLWERAKKFPGPNFNMRALDEMYVEQTAPEYKDRVMRSEQEILAEQQAQMQAQMMQRGMPGQVQMGAPGMQAQGGQPALPAGPGAAVGAGDPLAAMAEMGDLVGAYSA